MKAENILLAECFEDLRWVWDSTFSAWQELTKEWNAVLVDAGIGMFHMADLRPEQSRSIHGVKRSADVCSMDFWTS